MSVVLKLYKSYYEKLSVNFPYKSIQNLIKKTLLLKNHIVNKNIVLFIDHILSNMYKLNSFVHYMRFTIRCIFM